MVDPAQKSTAAPSAGNAEVAPGVWLDSRLALIHRESSWMAVSDIHYGYEVSRRAAGGLFPMWGMSTIEERFAALLVDHAPETVILVGDIVDGGLANREALDWLESVSRHCKRLVLVAGNHDRREIRREWDFVDGFETGDGFFFHHGHQNPAIPEGARFEVTGHFHPSVSLSDGAGLRLRMPCLIQERQKGGNRERWILPAFSLWAGGGRWQSSQPGNEIRQWVCGEGRVFEWPDQA